MSEVCIVAVKYLERDWQFTKQDIERCNVPVIYVDREPPGIGGLAEAINRGFHVATTVHEFEFVWFVTNVHFGPSAIPQLLTALRRSGFAAMHPAFASDHKFLRKGAGKGIAEVPFVEFTAPMIRREVFARHRLNPDMPYIGHDLDWGYRVRQEGLKIGVDYTCTVEHTYNRKMAGFDRVTAQRAQLRYTANKPTLDLIEQKYGADWRSKLSYYGKF